MPGGASLCQMAGLEEEMARKIKEDVQLDDFLNFDLERSDLRKYLSKFKLSPEDAEEIFLRILNEYMEEGATRKKREKTLN